MFPQKIIKKTLKHSNFLREKHSIFTQSIILINTKCFIYSRLELEMVSAHEHA